MNKRYIGWLASIVVGMTVISFILMGIGRQRAIVEWWGIIFVISAEVILLASILSLLAVERDAVKIIIGLGESILYFIYLLITILYLFLGTQWLEIYPFIALQLMTIGTMLILATLFKVAKKYIKE